MPYSKNPHKYPPEMEQILAALMTGKLEQLALPCETEAQAKGKRVQLQSYFAAVEREAKVMKEMRDKLLGKALSAQGKEASGPKAVQEAEYREAEALKVLWEERALCAMKWMVRVQGPQLIIERRKSDTQFANAVAQALAGLPAEAAACPSSAADADTLIDDGVAFIAAHQLPAWWPADASRPETWDAAEFAQVLALQHPPSEVKRIVDTAMSLALLRQRAGQIAR